MLYYLKIYVLVVCCACCYCAGAQTPLYTFCQEITTSTNAAGDDIITFDVGVQRSTSTATSNLIAPDLYFGSFSIPVWFDNQALEFLSIDYNEDIWDEHYSELNPFYQPYPITIGTPTVNYTGFFYASGADMKPSSFYSIPATAPLESLFQAHFKKIGSYSGLAPVRAHSTPDVNDGFYDSHLGSCYDVIVKPLSEFCEYDLIIDNTTVATDIYAATNTITSYDAIVATGSDVTYHAGQMVSMEANFCVEPGAEFHAYIEPCMNMFAEANVSVYLQGTYKNQATGRIGMTAQLGNLIPKTSPYSAAPYNVRQETVTEIPSKVVDWVVVEVRDQHVPSIVLSSRAALLQEDGSVITKDGSPTIVFDDLPAGDYHVAVRHRNHLGIMTAKPITLQP